jgi:replicative DNA helicase
VSTGLHKLAASFDQYRLWARDPTPRIGLGLSFFDGRTNGGVGKSEIAMLMASSSVGKTAIGLNIIRANPLVPALFISLEMDGRMLAARLAAMTTGVGTTFLEEELKRGVEPPQIQQTIDSYPYLVVDSTPGLAVKDMAASVSEATEILGVRPRLVIVDYLELIGGTGILASKTEAVDKVAVQLRNFTRKHDVSTIILHQVGKGDGGGGSEPLALDSGRYGGHQPMDYVIGAYAPRLEKDIQPDKYERVRDEVYLQLLKNRSGSAHAPGVRHRLDPLSLRLSGWGDTPWRQQPMPGIDLTGVDQYNRGAF